MNHPTRLALYVALLAIIISPVRAQEDKDFPAKVNTDAKLRSADSQNKPSVASNAPQSQTTVGWPQYVTWLIAVLSLCVGGLGGSLLTLFATVWRNRIQPISYRSEHLFSSSSIRTGSNVQALITLVRDGIEDPYTCDNLAVSQVEFINRANRDYASFRAKISLSQSDSIIHAEYEPPDKSHKLTFGQTADPDNPVRHLDVIMEPFNRGEVYSVRLFIELVTGQHEPGKIVPTTPEVGVRMVELPSIPELADLALEALAPAWAVPLIKMARATSKLWVIRLP